MPLVIDRSIRSPNHSARPLGPPDSIVLHTGEGSRASDLFVLCNDRVPLAKRVSAHYYVARDGRVLELVDPDREAWHAGMSFYQRRSDWNIHSIGIETEHRRGQDWPAAQRQALADLCRDLIARYRISPHLIAAHRWIAVPAGRKSDPSDWSDADLRAWIAGLYQPQSLTYRVRGLPIYQQQSGSGPLAGHLTVDEQVVIDATYANGMGHLADGRGFVDLDGLEALP